VRVGHRRGVHLNADLQLAFSNSPGIVAFARLSGPTGKFVNFSIDKPLAEKLLAELQHHLKRYEERNGRSPLPTKPLAL
jgi:hypothetical protein